MRSVEEKIPYSRLITVIAVLLLMGGGLWGAFRVFSDADNGKIAILRAEAGPYKTKPEDPGGMKVPYQDKLVFNAVSSEGKMVTVERLLPSPEQPVFKDGTQAPSSDLPTAAGQAAQEASAANAPSLAAAAANVKSAVDTRIPGVDTPAAFVIKPSNEEKKMLDDIKAQQKADLAKVDAPQIETPKAAPAAQKAEAQAAAAVETATAEPEAAQDAEPSLAQEAAEEAQAAAPAEKEPAEKAPVEKTEKIEKAPVEKAPEKTAASASDESGRFQLASFRDRPSAEKAIKSLKTRFGSALGGASLFVAEAEIKGKGRVFRVQGGSDNAGNVCENIRAAGGTCVLVH